MSKKLLFITLPIIFFLIISSALAFFPSLFPRQTLKGIYITNNISNSDLPKVRDWWNPINPTFVNVEEVDNGKGGKDQKIILYPTTRTSLFDYKVNIDPKTNIVDVTTIPVTDATKYSKEELKNIAAKYDLTKQTPDNSVIPTNSSNKQTDAEFIKKQGELKKQDDKLPVECQTREWSNFGTTLAYKYFTTSVISRLNTQFNYYNNELNKEILKVDDKNQVNGFGNLDSNLINYTGVLIQDPQYPRIKLVQLYFGDMKPKEQIKPEDKLAKVFVVLQDCTRIEVPAKTDGTFDFDGIKDKLK